MSGNSFSRAKKVGGVTIKDLMQLVENQAFRCALTGLEITPQRSSLDHKEPLSLGGGDDVANLQVVLPVINRSKTTMSHAQFVSMCHAVARHLPDYGDTTWVADTPPKGSSERSDAGM